MHKQPAQEAAFTMEQGDRFHAILCSHPVRFDDRDKAEIVLTFYVIRRERGAYTIVNVNHTYDSKGNCVTRAAQTKDHIPADEIEQNILDLRRKFTAAVEAGSGRKLEWDSLDLSNVAGLQEQAQRIDAWGRVGVRVAVDLPHVSLN